MTKLLERAFAEAAKLSETEQDLLAVRLLSELRTALANETSDATELEWAFPDLTEEQKQELDRRVADLDVHPEDVLAWDEIKARVRGRP